MNREFNLEVQRLVQFIETLVQRKFFVSDLLSDLAVGAVGIVGNST